MGTTKDWNELVADEKIASQKAKIAKLEAELAKAKMELYRLENPDKTENNQTEKE